MTHHPEDLRALHEEFRDVFAHVVDNERFDAMLVRAEELKLARRKEANERSLRAFGREMKRDLERSILGSILGSTAMTAATMYRCHCGNNLRADQWDLHGCGHCGRVPQHHPHYPRTEDSGWETLTEDALRPARESLRCIGCGASASEGEEHRKDCVYHPGAAVEYMAEYEGHKVALTPSGAEPELTPAERTWRAHKGFSR